MTRRTYEWVTDIHAAMARKALEEAGWVVTSSSCGTITSKGESVHIATSNTGLVMIAENVGAITFGPNGEAPAGA